MQGMSRARGKEDGWVGEAGKRMGEKSGVVCVLGDGDAHALH